MEVADPIAGLNSSTAFEISSILGAYLSEFLYKMLQNRDVRVQVLE